MPSLTAVAGMTLTIQPASFPGLGQGPRSGGMPRQSFQVLTPSWPRLPGGASLRPKWRRMGSWASFVNQEAFGTGGRTVSICYKRVTSARHITENLPSGGDTAHGGTGILHPIVLPPCLFARRLEVLSLCNRGREGAPRVCRAAWVATGHAHIPQDRHPRSSRTAPLRA